MTKLTLDDVTNAQSDQAFAATINSNSDTLEEAFDNTLSRDGTSPNQMNAALDMNSNRILNLPAPSNDYEPLRLKDLTDFDGTVVNITNTNAAAVTFSPTGSISSSNVQAAIAEVATDAAAAYQPLDADLTAIAALGSTGLAARTASDTWAQRTITGTSDQITVTNGSGVSGNPTISLSAKPAFKVTKSTNQTGISDSAFADVTWDTEAFDTGSDFASNTWTPPAGLVVLSTGLLLSGTMTNGATTAVAILKNAGNIAQGNQPAQNNAAVPSISVVDRCNGTDTYKVQAFMDLSTGSGSVITNSATFFSGAWLSP